MQVKKLNIDMLMRCLFYSFFLFFIYSCTENKAGETAENPATIRAELSPTLVKTAKVVQKNFVYSIETTGKITPLHQQKFYAEITGYLESFAGNNGKVVKKGEVIAQFDDSALAMELERAKLNHYNTGLEYKSEMLGFSKGNGATVSDSIRRKIEVSSGYGGAKIDLQKAQLAIEKTTLHAPFSGTLADVKAQRGAWVKSGDELFTLFTSDALLAEVKVLETDIHHIARGQPAHLFPVSLSARIYSATVFEINPVVDEHGLVLVKLNVKNPAGLLPGMNVRATIQVPQQNTLVVPKEALVIRSGKPVVFTLEEGLAKWNYVTVGMENESEVEIKEGITVDQIVIVSNNLQLAHDAPVQEEQE